ncbi:MAG: helix-turn-helix domain-containing protein [Phormidesmis sp.]
MNHKTSVLDLTNQQEAVRVLPHSPLIDSYRTGWEGLTFTHYCHPPYETVEHCLLQHSLVITDDKSCFKTERRLDGKLNRYTHGRGRIDIIPAFLRRSTHWDQEIEFSVIAISPTLLNQTTQALTQREVELIPQLAVDDPVIQQLAIALKTEIQTGCLSGKLYGESLGTALAARLAQNYAASNPLVKSKVSRLAQSQLARLVDYIEANLEQDLSISDLATLTGMSPSHFSRAFKHSVGIAPYQYVLQQRVERAKQLLKQRAISISEVALACGFANQTHLTKVFRKLAGTTPKAYQQR